MPRRPIVLAMLVAAATTLIVLLIVRAPAGGARVAAGEPVPPIAGTTLDGAPFDLAALRGRPVIVNFWASWCIPCRDEFPLFEAALQTHAADGLTIVGVLFEDQPDAAAAFMANFDAGWPSVPDADGALAARFRVVAPPQTFFIDPSGTIQSIQIGELTEADFERQYARIAP
jgi:cytochrome c biogenesis protein CcmG, thiol:disulfide interchange protein DsbE